MPDSSPAHRPEAEQLTVGFTALARQIRHRVPWWSRRCCTYGTCGKDLKLLEKTRSPMSRHNTPGEMLMLATILPFSSSRDSRCPVRQPLEAERTMWEVEDGRRNPRLSAMSLGLRGLLLLPVLQTEGAVADGSCLQMANCRATKALMWKLEGLWRHDVDQSLLLIFHQRSKCIIVITI